MWSVASGFSVSSMMVIPLSRKINVSKTFYFLLLPLKPPVSTLRSHLLRCPALRSGGTGATAAGCRRRASSCARPWREEGEGTGRRRPPPPWPPFRISPRTGRGRSAGGPAGRRRRGRQGARRSAAQRRKRGNQQQVRPQSAGDRYTAWWLKVYDSLSVIRGRKMFYHHFSLKFVSPLATLKQPVSLSVVTHPLLLPPLICSSSPSPQSFCSSQQSFLRVQVLRKQNSARREAENTADFCGFEHFLWGTSGKLLQISYICTNSALKLQVMIVRWFNNKWKCETSDKIQTTIDG